MPKTPQTTPAARQGNGWGRAQNREGGRGYIGLKSAFDFLYLDDQPGGCPATQVPLPFSFASAES